MPRSAGILMYRLAYSSIEVLIGHPGGPLWANRHEGAWSVVKGEIDEGEDAFAAAQREFTEETGGTVDAVACRPLGEITQRGGKVVTAWACPGDFDPANFVSETFELEWPPRSGRTSEFPELDEVRWCAPDEARRLLNAAQAPFIDRLEAAVATDTRD